MIVPAVRCMYRRPMRGKLPDNPISSATGRTCPGGIGIGMSAALALLVAMMPLGVEASAKKPQPGGANSPVIVGGSGKPAVEVDLSAIDGPEAVRPAPVPKVQKGETVAPPPVAKPKPPAQVAAKPPEAKPPEAKTPEAKPTEAKPPEAKPPEAAAPKAPEPADAQAEAEAAEQLPEAMDEKTAAAIVPAPAAPVPLAPVQRQTRLVFAPGADVLKGIDTGALGQLAQELAGREDRIVVEAYAQVSEGGESAARRLATQRALAVREFLISKGIRSTRVELRALGSLPQGAEGPGDRVDVRTLGK